MAVTKVTAWQTSTGQCYARKSEAYHEEMVHLVRTRGETNALKPVNESSFQEAIDLQTQLVEALKELQAGLAPRDKEAREELESLLSGAEAWLESATRVKEALESGDL